MNSDIDLEMVNGFKNLIKNINSMVKSQAISGTMIFIFNFSF